MPYSRGPYSEHSTLPAPARPELHSSRAIDFEFRRYEINGTTGGSEGMRDTAQRVILLLSFGVTLPKFLTDQGAERIKADCRTALAILSDGPRPAITLSDVRTFADTYGRLRVEVDFVDLTTGANDTVQLT